MVNPECLFNCLTLLLLLLSAIGFERIDSAIKPKTGEILTKSLSGWDGPRIGIATTLVIH